MSFARFGEFVAGYGGARRTVPQFRKGRVDPQYTHILVLGAFRPPDAVALFPKMLCKRMVPQDLGRSRDRKISPIFVIHRGKSDVG